MPNAQCLIPISMIADSPDGVILTVHVQPNAARTEYVGVHGDALKFRVAAPPVEGTANDALCAYLARRFGLARSAVSIKSGRGARRKYVLIRGIPGRRVAAVLECRPEPG